MEGITTEMVFYSSGFFGYGETGDFKAWSMAHIIPIILTIAAILLIYKFKDKIREWKSEETFRFIYAFVMIFVEMSYFWRIMYVGCTEFSVNTLINRLPLQVCEWTMIICAFMMMKKSENLFYMIFFLTMSANLLAVFVPFVIVKTGPTYYRYYQYWLEHLMPIVGMFYMMFVYKFKVKLRGIIYVFAMLVALAVPAIIMNSKFEACNYLYLKNDSTTASLGFLPDSVVLSALIFAGALGALFTIAYLVYRLLSRRSAV